MLNRIAESKREANRVREDSCRRLRKNSRWTHRPCAGDLGRPVQGPRTEGVKQHPLISLSPNPRTRTGGLPERMDEPHGLQPLSAGHLGQDERSAFTESARDEGIAGYRTACAWADQASGPWGSDQQGGDKQWTSPKGHQPALRVFPQLPVKTAVQAAGVVMSRLAKRSKRSTLLSGISAETTGAHHDRRRNQH
jgi:hypothetical protein